MAIKPDTFLLITLTSGVCIIIIGLIIVLHCPLHALSCSWWCYKIRNFYQLVFQRRKRKEIINSINTASISSLDIKHKKYGVSLVEGRPQGHGFYTAGPWTSSTDTTSTTLSTAENLQNITLMAQLGLVGSEYYSVIMNSADAAAANSNIATTSNANPFSYIFANSNSSNPAIGYHGDNSSALMTLSMGNQQAGTNGRSEGSFPESSSSGNTGMNLAVLPTSFQQQTESPVGSGIYHMNDSLYSVDVGGDDMDADMIMMM